jgi:hypothetical protein
MRTNYVYDLTVAMSQRQIAAGGSGLSWTTTYTNRWTNTMDQVVTNAGVVSTNQVPQYFTVVETNGFPPFIASVYNPAEVALAPKYPIDVFTEALWTRLKDYQAGWGKDYLRTNYAAGWTNDPTSVGAKWTASNLVEQAGGQGGIGLLKGTYKISDYKDSFGVFNCGTYTNVTYASLWWNGTEWAYPTNMWHDGGAWDEWARYGFGMGKMSEGYTNRLTGVSCPWVGFSHCADTNTNAVVISVVGNVYTGLTPTATWQTNQITVNRRTNEADHVQLPRLYWGPLAYHPNDYGLSVSLVSGTLATGDQIRVYHPSLSVWTDYYVRPPMHITTNWLNGEYRLIDAMKWTVHSTVLWTNDGSSDNANSLGYDSGTAWADSHSWIESVMPTNSAGYSLSFGAPYQYTGHNEEFVAVAYTRYARAMVDDLITNYPHRVELWVCARSYDTFTNNGVAGLADAGHWWPIWSNAYTMAGCVTSDIIGDVTGGPGSWPADAENVTKGYAITNARWIVRYDLTNTPFLIEGTGDYTP